MNKVLVIGAGLSTNSLIHYLLENSTKYGWTITVADMSLESAKKRVNNHPNGKAIQFDINNSAQLADEISKVEVVVSMLPAFMHPIVAKECVKQGKHLLTASYVSDTMKALNDEAKQKGIALLNELGLDPGIDHMSAMRAIDDIRGKGGKILGFISNTGGLVAPECDNNPWNYKFTWNPRNVVLAGQGVAQFMENGQYKYIPYHRLYNNVRTYDIKGFGEFEMYPNRDSLKYRQIYGIEDVKTIIRGTLRRSGYSKAWNVFVQLGMTDDTYKVANSEKLTRREFLNSFLPYHPTESVEEKLKRIIPETQDEVIYNKVKWLGMFDNEVIGMPNASPAQLLQKIMEGKLGLDPNDKDLIVMLHVIDYELKGKKYRKTSTFVIVGKDPVRTAMSITVGTPLAIATKMLLTGQITDRGVVVPIKPHLYNPILNELENYDVKFVEEEKELD
ncbi:MAG: saccharopine dehydrogenase NADP-binding domain-containing protein [Bacteroidales bacterium]|nr:saccharopine dehydrogenase NADP-binding domain-containing protein [Bacteroidales bacterium]HPD95061.1 saccharopine dehydrogenase C-terminal domain-containing protein [Tenuifilaceae bacterium]HRX30375.1 saccharopine dehydrogenase C-terminal domain-containing protein [Tenuifilaceae bacterium]